LLGIVYNDAKLVRANIARGKSFKMHRLSPENP